MAKEFLSQKGVTYADHDVTTDRKALEEMIRISGGRSVPVIVVCEQVIVGFDRARLEQALNCMHQRSEV
jgi:glutaredoxin